MSNKPPIEVPQGAIRLNTDSQKLEFFAQDRWYEMATDISSTATTSTRGIVAMDEQPSPNDVIEYHSMTTAGNAVDFGDLLDGVGAAGFFSSATRAIRVGGVTSYPGTFTNRIDFITIATAGDATEYGDLASTTRRGLMSGGNATRGIVAGGGSPTYLATQTLIDFVTIDSLGNTSSFGDLSSASSLNGSSQIGNATRGILAPIGSNSPSKQNRIDYITIATTGDSTDFGDLTTDAIQNTMNASNPTRGIIAGGYDPSPGVELNTIDVITISTLGNASDFGDMNDGTNESSAASSPIRGAFVTGSSNSHDHIETIEFATGGNNGEFGDLTQNRNHNCSVSNCHGGLG